MKKFPSHIILLGTFLINLLIASCSGSDKQKEITDDKKETTDSTKTAVAEHNGDKAVAETPQGNPMAESEVKMVKNFMIVGSGPDIRAFSTFSGREAVTRPYLNMVEDYRKAFPDLNLYAIVIPGQTAYYVPDKMAEKSPSMAPAYEYLRSHLDPSVKYVDVYNALAAHTKENIFLRTDHHWAPLGAYYTARALAAAAGVPFKDLSEYDKHINHGYVGSMYKYTGEQAIKDNPEEFVYYTPKNSDVQTIFITYRVNKDTGAISESGPSKGNFFRPFPDGSGGAYCTFMGGDHYLVKVETGTPGPRRLLIVKDSHGNPIPAYLFDSFEQIHVVDYRYFTKNMKKYVADNKITDIALAFGINTSGSSVSMQKARDFLTQ